MARALPDIPELDWAEFWPQFQRRYNSATTNEAQHVTILGPTRTGKSVLAAQVAAHRPYVFALMSKPKDEPMRRQLAAQGYKRMLELPEPSVAQRVAIWPKFLGTASRPAQRAYFEAALEEGFRAGVWHCFADEGHYIAKNLRLGENLRTWLQQGASNGNGLILCAQRPAWLPRDIYSAAQHIFLFGTNDSVDLRTIGGLNGMDDQAVRATVAGLGRTYRFLYLNTADGTMVISRYRPNTKGN